MAFIPTVACVRSSMIFSLMGQQCINSLWITGADSFTQTQREDLNDLLHTWWTTTGKVQFSPQIALTAINTVNQESASAPSTQTVISPVESGTAATSAQANNVAMCVTLRTDLRGRNYRGRLYFGGLPTSSFVDQLKFTTGAMSGMLSALASLQTAIEAATQEWVVVSHYHAKAARAFGVATPITAISIDQYIDSQRRRLGLRGV